MQVEIFHVTISPPGGFTRSWWVPEYDIPCLRAAWPKAEVAVSRTGRIEDRFADAEMRRMSIEYAGALDGDTVPLFQRVYPSAIQFHEAFERAQYRREAPPPEVREAMAEARRVPPPAPAAPVVETEPEPADPLPSGEITVADCPEVKDEWLPVFAKAGLDTIEALAAAEPIEIDALPVRGLGKATAGKIVSWARAIRAARSLDGIGSR